MAELRKRNVIFALCFISLYWASHTKAQTTIYKRLDMNQLARRILVLILLSCSAYTLLAQNRTYEEWSSRINKYYVSLNATLIPSAEFGVGLEDKTSFHIKGGYLPNLSQSADYNTEMMLAEASFKFWLEEERFEGFYCEAGVVGGYSNANIREMGIHKGSKSNIHFGLDGGVGYIWRFNGLGVGLHMNLSMLAYLRGSESGKYVFRVHAPVTNNTGINISYVF